MRKFLFSWKFTAILCPAKRIMASNEIKVINTNCVSQSYDLPPPLLSANQMILPKLCQPIGLSRPNCVRQLDGVPPKLCQPMK